MNVRKPTDYSAMYGMLDQLMGAEFPQMELYFEIGKIVCAHPEKGTAVMAAEYLQANYPAADAGILPRLCRQFRAEGAGPEAGLDTKYGHPRRL